MKRMRISLTCIILTLLISACATQESASEAAPSNGNTIVCEVFYRSAAGTGLEAAAPIQFTAGNDQQKRNFESMALKAHFQDDEYEGRALSIAVTNLENGAEITRQLYQFDLQNPVENQFVGGHGFTGLNYVFQPDSTAEMQYFCSLK